MRRAPTEPDGRAVALSGRLFQRLLAAYPEAYRREYGPPMAQLFRDQCRDSWRAGRGWGLARLWLRVLPDLVKTSVLEHLSTLKERNTMLDRIGSLLRLRSAPRSVFFAVATVVFLLVVGTCTLTTFLLPDTYASSARLKVDWTVNDRAGQKEFEAIQSDAVLDKVIGDLDLNQTWGRKYARGVPLTTAQTKALLKPRLDLRPVRGTTSLIEIRVFSEDRNEAAALANAIAHSYREYRPLSPVVIVDRAAPGLRPVRPNKPANIAFGVVGGMFFASVAGAVMAGIAAWIGRTSRGDGAPPGAGAGPVPDLPHLGRQRAKSAVDRIVGTLWIGMSGLVCGLTLVGLVWLLIFRQSGVTDEQLLFLPVFGLCWGCNVVLGCFLLRGKWWARTCLGLEGVLFLIYFCCERGFALPHCPVWLGMVIFRMGTFMVGVLPYSQWVFFPLGLASLCALLWPRKETAAKPC